MYSASPGEARFFTSLGLLLESRAQVSLSLPLPQLRRRKTNQRSVLGYGLSQLWVSQ
ncbi:hypothetical protein RHGRI_007564 [Rhododendron griersonianum]|uniref:Uncharacterized protein n=1 Tax=Rhododendron griersonianum TaxID=479676 RepID=A0AAV6KX93_9ERIC|nr:hypothetical protein RHGRI_007564 [Rhododendron griersonianum]